MALLFAAPYKMCSNEQLPGILIQGQQKKFVDIYQYILVTVSSFVMTSTTEEFHLVEKTLIKNVMQPNPLCALLAIDIWCLLARYYNLERIFY